jgi:hypothetical protein
LNPHRQDMRGLERCLHEPISQWRSYHAKSLLQIQQRLPKGDNRLRERLLRRQSMHTSRRSRVMARLLAHADSLEVAAMVRHELLESEEGLGIADKI